MKEQSTTSELIAATFVNILMVEGVPAAFAKAIMKHMKSGTTSAKLFSVIAEMWESPEYRGTLSNVLLAKGSEVLEEARKQAPKCGQDAMEKLRAQEYKPLVRSDASSEVPRKIKMQTPLISMELDPETQGYITLKVFCEYNLIEVAVTIRKAELTNMLKTFAPLYHKMSEAN